MESTSELTVEQLHQIEKGVLDDVFTILKHQREPLIAKSQKDGEWLDTGEQAQLKLLTKLYGEVTDHIKELLGDESHD